MKAQAQTQTHTQTAKLHAADRPQYRAVRPMQGYGGGHHARGWRYYDGATYDTAWAAWERAAHLNAQVPDSGGCWYVTQCGVVIPGVTP